MVKNLQKRILTSFLLLLLITLAYINNFFLIIFLVFLFIFSFKEFNHLVNKIFIKKNNKYFFYKFLIVLFSTIYFLFFFYITWTILTKYSEYEKLMFFYCLLICVCTDIGGYFCGRIFKGKKLTKISPNKTYSGLFGSFIFSLFIMLFFINVFKINLFSLSILTLLISSISQLGDLFFSYIKRKAKVKNCSNILPGHGGILDRIDGILFGVPLGLICFYYL